MENMENILNMEYSLNAIRYLMELQTKEKQQACSMHHIEKYSFCDEIGYRETVSEYLVKYNNDALNKMLNNHRDICNAVIKQWDKHLRYIKQIKQRNCELVYDADNVGVCEISKPSNFLHFEFIGFSTEKEHLKVPSDKDKEKRKQEAAELKAQGKSYREIARQLGVSDTAVRKWFK